MYKPDPVVEQTAGGSGWRRRLQQQWEREREALNTGVGWALLALPVLGIALVRVALTTIPALATAAGKGSGLVWAGLTSIGVVASAAALSAWLGRRSLIATSRQIWQRTSVLAAAPLLIELSRPLEESRPFRTLVLIGLIAGFIGYWAYHNLGGVLARLDDAARHSRRFRLGLLLVCFFWLLYSVAVSKLAIDNHQAINTSVRDLGWYVNFFSRSSIGDLLGCTLCRSGTHLSGHFDPIIVLLTPFYMVYPYAETMLVMQAVWLGSGVIPLYLLALRLTKRLSVGVTLAWCYCVYPALHGVNLFEFHSLAFLVPVAIWVVHLALARRPVAYWLALLIMLLVREDAALVGICIGLSLALSASDDRKLGLLTILVCAGYFFVTKAFIMHRPDLLNQGAGTSGYAYYYSELIPKGVSGTSGLLGSLLTDPAKVFRVVAKLAKLQYVVQLLLPVLCLPLFARRHRFLLVYGFVFTLLATREHVFSVHYQYSSVLIPFVFVLAALGFERLFDARGPRLAHAACVACFAASCFCSWKFGAFIVNESFQGGFRPLARKVTPKQRETTAWLKTVCKQVPADSLIASWPRYTPHLGNCERPINFKRWREANYIVWADPRKRKNMGRILREGLKSGRFEEIGRMHTARLYRNLQVEPPKATPR